MYQEQGFGDTWFSKADPASFRPLAHTRSSHVPKEVLAWNALRPPAKVCSPSSYPTKGSPAIVWLRTTNGLGMIKLPVKGALVQHALERPSPWLLHLQPSCQSDPGTTCPQNHWSLACSPQAILVRWLWHGLLQNPLAHVCCSSSHTTKEAQAQCA